MHLPIPPIGAGLLFLLAFLSSANDMVNIVGTAVASQAMAPRRALVLGGLCSVVGYLLSAAAAAPPLPDRIGASLFPPSSPWRHGFCDTKDAVFAHGLLIALSAAVVVLALATVAKLPVSSTYAVVGGLLGMTLTYTGVDALDMPSLVRLALSWVAAPLLSALLSAVVYRLTARWILNTKHPQSQALAVLPAFYSLSLAGFVSVVVGRARPLLGRYRDYFHGISLLLGLVTYGLARYSLVPYVARHLPSFMHGNPCHPTLSTSALSPFASVYDLAALQRDSMPSCLMDSTFTRDDDDNEIPSLGDNPSVLQRSSLEWNGDFWCLTPPQRDAYYVFNYALLLLSALTAALYGMHAGTTATTLLQLLDTIQRHRDAPFRESDAPLWTTAVAAVGCFLGAVLLGRRVLTPVLHGACFVSPHRGFCMQVGPVVVLSLAVLLQVPTSSTHCTLSAIAAVSRAHYGTWKLERARFICFGVSWVLMLPTTIACAAGIAYALR
ncbi:hypothetical protein SPRG_09367 [Saprolegnia parasitica CBS 223.65]|uniref:Phosphate transporter n=1 Tax=Saprolegnia parasitica (strain CBS 223.65) TaxID=695850 RepID=A0A067C8C6_SAPPC|nr:hypothetical protein SPRG_09367 [Saprolegnia parasitica CBS 223.65]KDO25425.1 hypothetical protein SPRG_09367 [Saprolegnia parasitica CBS 223.65]|eukprot:XP_012203852.1 hypothetical protein SPRG_09367 [Saprolegnia parasitica CBS 223.65]